MPKIALVKLRTAEAHELLNQLKRWVEDQNLVAKPALNLIESVRKKIEQLHSAALTEYNDHA